MHSRVLLLSLPEIFPLCVIFSAGLLVMSSAAKCQCMMTTVSIISLDKSYMCMSRTEIVSIVSIVSHSSVND